MSHQPILDYIGPFLDYCEVQKGLSDNTQKNYHHYLQVFVAWLRVTKQSELQPIELTAQHVWDYRLHLARKYRTRSGANLSKKSQNFYLIALRALLRYLAERNIETLPSSKVTLAKQGTATSLSFLDAGELERLLQSPEAAKVEGLRDRAIMETLFSSGMRVSEIVNLDVDDVAVLATRRAIKTLELSIVGKGKRPRTIFLSTRTCSSIRTYLDARGPDDHKALFINTRTRSPDSRRLSPRAIELMVARYARAAGITKRVTPHTLRHTYATDLLSQGADLRSVQELLGHRSVATTQIYTHVTNKGLQDVHEKFHGKRLAEE
jgi:site-specific recombinase XerD